MILIDATIINPKVGCLIILPLQKEEKVGSTGPVCDPIGAYLPKLMDDEDIFAQFLRLWKFFIKQQAPALVTVHTATTKLQLTWRKLPDKLPIQLLNNASGARPIRVDSKHILAHHIFKSYQRKLST